MRMAAAMRRTARPDAAEEIADEVLALAGVYGRSSGSSASVAQA